MLGGERPERLVGQKGAGLRKLVAFGAPVPPGFTLTTRFFKDVRDNGGTIPEAAKEELLVAISGLEARTGRTFGRGPRPLLVSVRSGAPVSMPGMLETVLDVGIDDATREALAKEKGDARFAFDAHRRFAQMYAETVLGIPRARIAEALASTLAKRGMARLRERDLEPEVIEDWLGALVAIIAAEGKSPPRNAIDALVRSVEAVMASWDAARASRYRRHEGIDDAIGTAVTVQAMVFGNLGPDSGSGVLTTRHPTTGAKEIFGEFLVSAQGEDVVAGVRTPMSITVRGGTPGEEARTLERAMPSMYEELVAVCNTLERHFGDVLELEMTVERGKLFVLQARSAKRSPAAAVRIAVDLVRDGITTERAALGRIDAAQLSQIVRRVVPLDTTFPTLARGLPACAGAATGMIMLDPERALRLSADGHDVILVRRDTASEDVHAVRASAGLLAAAGGMTSHAAVVARGLAKPCVVGCSAVHIDESNDRIVVKPRGATEHTELRVGEVITLDGSTGRVFRGLVPTVEEPTVPEIVDVLAWADAVRTMHVYAIADSPVRAQAALAGGAEGIGLLALDTMLSGDVLAHARRIFFAVPDPKGASARVLETLIADALAPVIESAASREITVRFFDDVVSRLVPSRDGLAETARQLGHPIEELTRTSRLLAERRLGLGLRGARLGLVRPGLYDALVGAMVELSRRHPRAQLKIALPHISTARELAALRNQVVESFRRRDATPPPIGAVIGVPHACLEAREVAVHADFLAFDTHALTELVFGAGREDTAAYLHRYIHELEVFDGDPFVRFDENGVGRLIRAGAARARTRRRDLPMSLVGEVAGEPPAVRLAAELGMTGVACPPTRLLVARVAAAQSAA